MNAHHRQRSALSAGAEGLQFGALPFRHEAGALQVLLVTSRDTGRWVIPKGWPIPGKKPHRSAAREALEEAGLEGEAGKRPLGEFAYWKRLPQSFMLCKVRVYPLAVTGQRLDWREKGQRQLGWFSPEDAADLVDEAGLSAMILAFAAAQREAAPQRLAG